MHLGTILNAFRDHCAGARHQRRLVGSYPNLTPRGRGKGSGGAGSPVCILEGEGPRHQLNTTGRAILDIFELERMHAPVQALSKCSSSSSIQILPFNYSNAEAKINYPKNYPKRLTVQIL